MLKKRKKENTRKSSTFQLHRSLKLTEKSTNFNREVTIKWEIIVLFSLPILVAILIHFHAYLIFYVFVSNKHHFNTYI